MNTKRFAAALLTICLLCASFAALADGVPNITGTVAEVDKYGNLLLDITSDALAEADWMPGATLTVLTKDFSVNAPLGTSYSDVDTGGVIVRTKLENGAAVIVAVNMGNFSTTYGVTAGDPVTLAMLDPIGYLEEYTVRQLSQKRTYERADYASDAVYANFREVSAGLIGSGILFRSSSPVNNDLNRAAYADALAEAARIATVVNLADAEETIEGYFAGDGFSSEYYRKLYDAGHVVALDMGVDFSTEAFQAKLAEGLRFMLDNPAPYLLHCNEGKDRAGFVSLLLEMLMGASQEEMVSDYMESFINYYFVEPGSEQYQKVAESNAMGMLRDVAGAEKGASLEDVDLSATAQAYLADIGLNADEIEALKEALAK